VQEQQHSPRHNRIHVCNNSRKSREKHQSLARAQCRFLPHRTCPASENASVAAAHCHKRLVFYTLASRTPTYRHKRLKTETREYRHKRKSLEMLHLPRKNEHHLRQLKKSLAAAKNNRFYCQKRLAPITATSEVGAQCIARHRAQSSAVSAMHATQKTPAPDPAQRCNWHACHNLKAA
jgi:hypothetical protein